MQNSHDNTIEELNNRIEVLTQKLERKKVEDNKKSTKNKADYENHLESKKLFKLGLLELKIDNVITKLDNYQDVLVRNELDKAKLQLKLEMNGKIEEIENEFNKKLQATKKMCEKTVLKLKSAYLEENSNLKQLIKVIAILIVGIIR
jgi:hypothetical protein